MDPEKELENQAATFLGAFRAERDAFGGVLLNALRDAIPWGLKVDLGNGMVAELVKVNGNPDGSLPKQMPIYDDAALAQENAARDQFAEPIGFEEWSMTFDWRLTNCDQDHIEMTVKTTGGGGSA